MSKIITTTFLLKNPAKVREMVKNGIEVLVKFEGKIVMKIVIPNTPKIGLLPPTLSIKNNPNPQDTYRRVDIYNGKYDNQT